MTKTPVSNGAASCSTRRSSQRVRLGSSGRYRQLEFRIGNFNTSSIKRKDQQLADGYQLNIVGHSSAKRQGSGILNHRGLKLSYCFAIIKWKPASGSVAILRLKPQHAKTLTLIQVYAPNLEGEYETFLEEVQCALSEMPTKGSIILMGNFNVHVRVVAEK
ncbi:unnamed protein product [Soboliphyme baturini]|uniref:Endo/exonuclease/phosphatase domain-containing protein n=1 Tax=Soboliphyme baturini TaxID=241478 RepID=A0A183ICU9_9BILA|nr:unnamed protein product [Soboliphyme baturini]